MADWMNFQKYEIHTFMAMILFRLTCKRVCTKMSHTYWYMHAYWWLCGKIWQAALLDLLLKPSLMVLSTNKLLVIWSHLVDSPPARKSMGIRCNAYWLACKRWTWTLDVLAPCNGNWLWECEMSVHFGESVRLKVWTHTINAPASNFLIRVVSCQPSSSHRR